MQACFLSADILLPDAAADFEKWAVVACDQFTSQPEYWRKAAEIVGDAPSTLNLVYPEAYLAKATRGLRPSGRRWKTMCGAAYCRRA